MDQQNVTVSLPADLVREAKHLAVDQGVSLSKFVAMILEECVQRKREFRAAGNRQRDLLARGLSLGTEGWIDWRREDLHER